jgi:UDP-glucose 4-epimerase
MTSKLNSILLTGGAGYIGSHTCVALVEAGYKPVILDDFSNSSPAVPARLERITGRPVVCERGDVADTAFVQAVLQRHAVAAVVHFAGFKAVGESVAQPLKYYRNNVCGMVSLLEAMDAANCRKLVFSSSATVYGDPASVPITESFPTSYANPYGHSKLVCENMLAALRTANPAWRVGVLRYFNPVGAHPSGLIGEDPAGPPNNLMPYVAQVAVGKRPYLNVYGNDYATPDGTGVRDYIHVQDLAQGHVAALQALLDDGEGGESFTVNLGTGKGHSVLEVVRAFEQASGRQVPYQFMPRRRGDVAQCYADPALARRLLGWRATHSLADMCADAWRWQSQNPDGYE